MKTIAEMIEAARKSGRKRIAVAAAQEAPALEAVVDAWAQGLAEPILIGDIGAIKSLGASLGLDLSRFELIQAKDPAEAAAEAVRLVRVGDADVLMKGLVDSSVLLRAVFNRETGINAGRLASHVAVVESSGYHKLLFLSDAAINISPDVPAKIEIIANAVRAARALGLVLPKVALLAAVEKVNYEKMPCTVDAAILSQMGRRGQLGACLVDGPLALDCAISEKNARIKNLESEVAGDADILVVPGIEAGNILYKCLIDLCGARGAGIVMGAAAPIVLTSRSDSAETMLASVAFAALASR